MNDKYEKLKNIIRSYGKVAIAFSGGVDSALLLYAAVDAAEEISKVIAITATPQFVPEREKKEALDICESLGVKQIVAEIDGLSIEGFSDNPPDRCYICKKALFRKMLELANAEGCDALLEGSNLDDMGDYRPGLRALSELDIKSPLKEAGLTKSDIREISKELNLTTWDKPSFACLASRFVYGERITAGKLSMVEQAEDFLMSLGLKQFRVRMHGEDLARIEVPDEQIDIYTVMKNKKKIIEKFNEIGFRYISLDLQGYRTGSMNEAIGK